MTPSSPPRSRIDQFYPSRKRKPPLRKDEKAEKDPKSCSDVSPNAKGTLESYLVKSPDARSPVQLTVARNKDSLARESVKRNLTKEIIDAPKSVRIADSSSNNAVDEESTSSVQSGKGFNAKITHESSDKPISADLGSTDSEASRPGGVELKKFATDFLSLYCGELPSNASAPLEEDSKGQKRNGSPTLLVANTKTCSKRHRNTDQNAKELHDHFTMPVHGPCEVKNSVEGNEKMEATADCHRETTDKVVETVTEGHLKCAAFATLRKCSNTPITGSSKRECQTPGSADKLFGSHETPKSSFRKSIVSPGEDFWNEAIEIADCLLAPVAKPLVTSNDELGASNKESSQESSSPGDGMSSSKLTADRSSHDVKSHDDVGHSTFENAKLLVKSEGTISSKESGKKTDCTEEACKISSIQTEASPLPVKHFDFSNEQNVKKNNQKMQLDYPPPISHSNVNSYGVLVPCQTLPSKFVSSSKAGETIERASLVPDSSSTPGIISDTSAKFLRPTTEISCQPLNRKTLYDLPLSNQSLVATMEDHTSCQPDDRNMQIGVSGTNTTLAEKVIRHKYNANRSNEVSTPSSSMPLKDSLQLSNWLPPEICDVYIRKGISKLYSWQVDCLQVDGVLDKRNLVYCASTSAGKSFVAEILMLRRVLSTEKMAILVLPYVSICSEKAEHLEALLEPLGKHVRSFFGSQGGGSLPKDTSVAVCTIEKANSLINRLLEEGRLSEVGIIVIDELHMVGDQHRGYLLELMLTKLRYASGNGGSETSSGESSGSSSGKSGLTHGLQVVGMSATMPNVSAVADWLQAALYQTEFRPVPLEEYIKVGNTILNKKLEPVRTIEKRADLGGKDPDHVVELCNEIVSEGHSVLLFCSSRKGCESTARHISRFLTTVPLSSCKLVEGEYTDALSAVEALRRCPSGLDPVLEETLPSGVAYHHAGLTVEEREIVETCYRKGIVRVLTATSTLAAGVNLPARRVIFRQPKIGRDFIDGTRYRQMSGRAGRTGIDTKGESILICKPEEIKRISAILNDNCPPLQSCLSDDKNGMTHAILEVVAGGIVQTASDIHRYVRCTLLNSTKPFQDVVKSAQDSLRWLCQKKFLEWNEETKLYSVTPLGRASFGSSLSPEESIIVLDDLLRAREGFVLSSDLHIVYLVTPINLDVEPNWELYYEKFMQLSKLDQSVGNRVGVSEPFLMRMAHGATLRIRDRNGIKQNSSGRHDRSVLSDYELLRISKRFYVSLMLSLLVQEVPIGDVCDSFKVARGWIQSLQESAGRFASMLSVFCERLGWHDLEALISKFQNRVSFGVRAEIAELTVIPYVKGSRARALYKAGLRTPLAIAESSIREIAKALFEHSSWAGEEVPALRRMQLGVAKKIKNGARKIVFEKAEEAQLSAFAAFKSLGVNVPQISLPSLKNDASSLGCEVSHSEDLIPVEDELQLKEQPFRHVLKDGNVHKDNLLASRSNVFPEEIDRQRNPLHEVGFETKNDNAAAEVFSSEGKPKNLISVGQLPHTTVSLQMEYGSSHSLLNNHRDVKDQGTESSISNNSAGSGSRRSPLNAGSIPGGFDTFLDQWEAIGEFYFDIHFDKRITNEPASCFEIFGLAICWRDSPIYYVNLSKDLMTHFTRKSTQDADPIAGTSNINSVNGSDVWNKAEQRWLRITTIMGKIGVRKISWNLKIQVQVLHNSVISIHRFGATKYEQKDLHCFKLIDNVGISLPSIDVRDAFDMCLFIWILWPDEESCSSPNLDKIVKKHLSTEVASAAVRDGRWKNQMHKAAHNGCCRRVAQVRALACTLWRLLVSENLFEALTRTENPLVRVLADMELWGIGVDLEGCLQARHVIGKKLKELELEAYKLAGVSFSLHSTADIAHILYTKLKLSIPEVKNKGKKHPSTDKHSLDFLRDQHPIISVIKEHRTLSKLFNCTLGSICAKAKLCLNSQKYIIKGRWLQTSTATGRLSMEDPNLQCVEHAIEVKIHSSCKSDSGSDVETHLINPRSFFVPTQDNWVLLTADYSQIELRLMAHFSGDTSLVELLSKPNGDVFTMLAARWTKKPETLINPKEREHTKRLVYGILYGMGANSLAEQLECSFKEAAEKIQSFKSSFPGVSSWLHGAVESCRSKGHVETLMGRKRYLSKIKGGSSNERSKAQRQAVNSICQGSAADIIKIAMIRIHSIVVEGCEACNGTMKQYSRLKGHCRILLQVHDELVLEADPYLVRDAGQMLKYCMETAASLLVPLRVKLMVGRSWGSLESFDPNS